MKEDINENKIQLNSNENLYYKTFNNLYYPQVDKSYDFIVDALNSINVDSSFENRKKIAQKNKVRDYIGTTNQNNQLLEKLKAGRLIK